MQNQSSGTFVSDLFLIEEIKSGNVRAFDLVFDKYYKNLCRFAFNYTRDDDLSQSLVQDVFVKLWEKRHKLGSVENLAGYLAVMVKNRCADYLKKQKNIDFSGDVQDNRTEVSTESMIYSKNFEENLIIALSNLPPRCKQAFEYSRFENMTNKEIAVKLGVTVKGVEALIGRSLKLLRTELSEFLPSFNIDEVYPILLFMRYMRTL